MADLKKECDDLAHQAARNVARAGFAGIVSWWGVVYYLTFQTELGWDVMEPVTVSLPSITSLSKRLILIFVVFGRSVYTHWRLCMVSLS